MAVDDRVMNFNSSHIYTYTAYIGLHLVSECPFTVASIILHLGFLQNGAVGFVYLYQAVKAKIGEKNIQKV